MKKSLLAAFCFLAVVSISSAQSPRKVLIQEFGGWSCDPCAKDFSVFRPFIVDSQFAMDVAVLAYHANWSSNNDIMGLTNPASPFWYNYYNVSAIPQYFINGSPLATQYQGYFLPTTQTIKKYVDSVTKVPSPITLKLQMTRSTDTSIHIHEVISTTESLSGKMLRTEIGENYHYYSPAGINGENSFYWIARAMLPDTTNVVLQLAAGDSEQFDYNYTVPDGITDSALYAVAFVQNYSTHEILQCAFNDPLPVIVDSATPTTVPLGGTASRTLLISNPNAMSTTVEVFVDSSSKFYDPLWSVSSIAPLVIAGHKSVTVTLTIHAHVTNTANVLPLKIISSIQGMPAQIQSVTFPVRTPGNSALFMLDNASDVIDTADRFYVSAVQALPSCSDLVYFDYVWPEVIDTAFPFPPDDYKLVILRSEDGKLEGPQGNLDSALDRVVAAGGRILFNSTIAVQNWSGSSFFSDMGIDSLGTIFLPKHAELLGIPGDSISNGLDISVPYFGPNFGYLDEFKIKPGSGAIPILSNNGNKGFYCGFRYQYPNGARFVYIAPDIARMTPPYSDTLLARAVAWLMATTQSIALGPITKLQYCVGETITVPYSASGSFNSDNHFRLQLSDPSGSFDFSTDLGDNTGLQGSFTVPISKSGSYYRVRVISTDPSIVSPDDGVDIEVSDYPNPKASLVIGMNLLSANATDTASGPAVMIDQMANFVANSVPAADIFHWSFDGDASVTSAAGTSVNVSYPTAGLKTGTLTAVNSFGCGKYIYFAIRVLDCRPTIPKNAHIVAGFERVMDTFVWVKSGGVDTVDNTIPYPQTIYVEPGGMAFGTADVAWNTFYLKSGATINHLPERGTLINSTGIRDTFEAQVPADTLSCDNLDFDYSQVLAGVTEESVSTLSLHQSGDHLFANSEETPAEIRIMNVLGAEVLSQRGVGALDVDLSALAAGVYFAVVQSADAREVRKIAVVH